MLIILPEIFNRNWIELDLPICDINDESSVGVEIKNNNGLQSSPNIFRVASLLVNPPITVQLYIQWLSFLHFFSPT